METGKNSKTTYILIAVGCLIYLSNLTAGADLLPDDVLLLGNIDEGVVSALLIRMLNQVGFDLSFLGIGSSDFEARKAALADKKKSKGSFD